MCFGVTASHQFPGDTAPGARFWYFSLWRQRCRATVASLTPRGPRLGRAR